MDRFNSNEDKAEVWYQQWCEQVIDNLPNAEHVETNSYQKLVDEMLQPLHDAGIGERQAAKAIEAAWNAHKRLTIDRTFGVARTPEWMNEVLNSGDGTYQP